MNGIAIRSYIPEQDEAAVYGLWQQTLGATWSVSRQAFQEKTVGSGVYQPGDHAVALAGPDIVGFIDTQVRTIPGAADTPGELMAIMVAPAYQRQGIGRTLLEHGLASLRRRGAAHVQLGAGGVSYFWPGAPCNLSSAWPFFAACGWQSLEASYDLIRDLGDYATPPEVYARLRRPGVTLAPATADDVAAVLAFERTHFPQWLVYYERVMAQGDPADVVIARDARDAIVGTSYVWHPGQPWHRTDFVWDRLLGENTGGVGPLGVAEEAREQGIGLALAAWVTEQLQARGVPRSYVGYTWLVDWYGKLGYQVWREYRMSGRSL